MLNLADFSGYVQIFTEIPVKVDAKQKIMTFFNLSILK
jgi:hypothetical protein